MLNNRNLVAATLAVTAMLGFLAIFAFLAIGNVPAGNKDFFNMALVALIGFVGTAFGYYLGSSQGSADKNGIIARTPPSAETLELVPGIQAKTSESGFIRPNLCVAVGFLGLLLIGSMLIYGCATTGKTETPESTSAKALLSARQTIISAAKTTDDLCSQGVLKQADCSRAAQAYSQAEAAYNTASTAFVMAIQLNTPQAWQDYQAAVPQLMALTMDIDTLAKSFQEGGK